MNYDEDNFNNTWEFTYFNNRTNERISIVSEINEDSTWEEVLDVFDRFLKATGFVFDINDVLTYVNVDGEDKRDKLLRFNCDTNQF